MTDIIPERHIMTFPQGYNNPTIREWGIEPKYSVESRYSIGVTNVRTSFGNEVKVYNRERTLCDLIQKRHLANQAVLLDAIKRYVNFKDKDLNRLMKYADIFQVEKKIRPYIEILL